MIKNTTTEFRCETSGMWIKQNEDGTFTVLDSITKVDKIGLVNLKKLIEDVIMSLDIGETIPEVVPVVAGLEVQPKPPFKPRSWVE
jgi:hypothetical protein